MRRMKIPLRMVVMGSLVLLLLLGLMAAVFLSRFSQDTRNQASVSQGPVQVRWNSNNQTGTPGQTITTNLQVNTGGRQIDGLQLVYNMTGTYPTTPMTFTPVSTGRFDLANPQITTSENGIYLRLGLITKNPTQPFSSTSYVTVGTLSYAAPASGSFTLVPEPTASQSKAIEHSTLQDILRSVFTAQYTFNVAAPTPSPSASPIVHAAIWETQYARLVADDFNLQIGNRTFHGIPDNGTAFQVSSNPGSGSNQTLEMIWQEQGVEMRLFIYFQRVNNTWSVSEVRTYNGQNPGGWLFYSGNAFGSHAIGNPVIYPTLSLTSDNQSAIVGTINLTNARLTPFLQSASVIPSPSIIVSSSPSPSPVVCPADVFQCPDGSFVSRSATRNCQFLPCPTPPASANPSPSPSLNPSPSASPGTCNKTADITGDGRVNLFDYTALITAYLGGNASSAADLNCDNVINILDYTILVTAFRAQS